MMEQAPDQVFREFLEQGKLMLQRSRETGRFVFYPRVAEPGTGCTDLEWVWASGRGTVPVAPLHAAELLSGLKDSRLFEGYRCGEKVDIGRLADTVTRISEFLADFGDAIASIDVNPVICTGDRSVAVDALVILNGQGLPH